MVTKQQTRTTQRSKQLHGILDAVSGEIRPVTVTAGYRWATVFVALGMLILPVLYVVILLLFGYGLFWHATANFRPLTSLGLFGIITYGVPLVIGPIILLFLVKPFLAGSGTSFVPKRLKREAEPFLYDYVEAIARAVHAPPPTSIRVDCDANAGAGFRRGVWSMFTSDMSLTLGLPLVAGLNLKQLSGVLAHEFGHFAQRGGMRTSYFIRTMVYWFVRVTYERDAWDHWLYWQSAVGNPAVRAVFYTLRFFVWLARWVPWSLLMLGYMLSCHLARQQEFDADRYETRLVGRDVFEATTKRLPELSVAVGMAFDDLRVLYDEGRLADDLPALIIANLKYLTPELRSKLRKAVREQETRLFDTHPSERERIASARAERTDGILRLPNNDHELPATVIFRDFTRLCKVVTREFYVEAHGLKITKRDLHPVKELMERIDARIESVKTLHRYFQVKIPLLWPLPLDQSVLKPPDDPKELREIMKQARSRMLAELPAYQQAAKQYEIVEEKLHNASEALALFDVGLHPRGSDFGLPGNSYDDAYDQYHRAESATSRLAGNMLGFEMAAGERLSAALRLLQIDLVVERIENGTDLRFEMKNLINDAMFLSKLMTDLRAFRVFYGKVTVLCAQLDSRGNIPDLIDAILDQLNRFYERLEDVEERLQQQMYPFDHAKADMTMREYALPHLPPPEHISGRLAATQYLFEQLISVQLRLFARLAQAAEKVEDAFQLPRLPQPKEEEEEEQKKDDRRKDRRRR